MLRVKGFHLGYISLSNNKHELAVFLHHSAILQDTLHLHSNLLAPGGLHGLQDPRLQHILPQQPVLYVREEEKIMKE